MRRVIADSTRWAAVSRRAVLDFESGYSQRMYVDTGLRVNRCHLSEDVSLDDLRALLAVSDGSLRRWRDPHHFTVGRAVDAINQLAGFTAAYVPIKRDRRLVGVRLASGHNVIDDLVEAQLELDRPYIDRTARRDCLIETIAQERHRLAESLARAETAVEAEREQTALRQRHLDDVRRMLPPPDSKPRRWRWCPLK